MKQEKKTRLRSARISAAMVCAAVVWAGAQSHAEAREMKVLPNRWFRAEHNVAKPEGRRAFTEVVRTAAAHGYNGVLLSTRFASFDIDQPETLEGLLEIKAVCDKYGIEIIPCVPGVGHGYAMYRRNAHLIAGAPVRNTLLVVRNGRAVVVPDPPAGIENGGFEKFEGNTFAGIQMSDPGRRMFVDLEVKKSGRASLRMEKVGDVPQGRYGMCRLCMARKLKVTPNRCYRFTCQVKTENLKSGRGFGMYVYKAGDASWPPMPCKRVYVKSTSDWRLVGYLFNSWDQEEVDIYVGLWGTRRNDPGKLWLDDVRFEELGPEVAVRREGTPVVLRKERTETPLVEGKDYSFRLRPRGWYFEWPGYRRPEYRGTKITILPNGPAKLKEGDRIRADWYQPVVGASVHTCMSEPGTYEIWRKWIELIHRHLKPSKYLLSMDEVRGGCTCALCKSRNMSNGDIIADCVNRQYEIIKRLNPRAEVGVWSDMFDPTHNAKKTDFYEWVPGGFDGSWKNLNRDIIIVVWGAWKDGERIRNSLKHFSENGFRILGSGYYSDENLDNTRAWLRELCKTPRPYGFMYTVWGFKYDLMPAFGDVISGRVK